MFRHVGLVSSLMVAALLSSCGTGAVSEAPTTAPAAPTAAPTAIPATPKPTDEPTPAALNAQQIAERLAASTVMIRANFPETAISYESAGSGTGFLIDDEGYLVTNAHVVEGASSVTVAVSGSSKERPAKIIGVSTCDDLAVLKVDNTQGLEPASLGKSSALKVGEEVVALGYPLGDEIGTDLSVTRGIVSKKETSLDHYESLIQTDTAINPGNSGGPLVNQFGEIIGINTLGMDADVATNINFAISIDQARPIIADLQDGENREWLGMNLVPNDYIDYFGVEGGMVVAAVDSGSPASRVDVQPADLLTRLEGSTITSQADVCKIMRSHSDGDQLKVELLRITESEQQLLRGEVVIGDATASAELDDLEIVNAVALGDAPPSDDQASADSGSESVNSYTYDFASDDGTWYTGEKEGHVAAIGEGSYLIRLTAADSYFLSPDYSYDEPDMAIGADILVEGDARAGVALRYSEGADSKSYYTCWIDASNRFGCFVSVDSQWRTLHEPATAGAILPGQVNRVVLTAFGDEIVFSVNGTDIASFSDSALSSGNPSLYLENFSSEAGAYFDNVTIVTPK